jgi:hypothetical protein
MGKRLPTVEQVGQAAPGEAPGWPDAGLSAT